MKFCGNKLILGKVAFANINIVKFLVAAEEVKKTKTTALSYNSEMVSSNLQLLLFGAAFYIYLGRTAG